MKHRGFSLIELILVLLIIGLGAAFIAPAISNSLINLRLKAATKQLSTVLRYARSRAVASKQTMRVLIDIDNASYSAQIPKGPEDGEAPSGSTAFPADIRFREVTLGGEVQDSGQIALLFYPKGNTSGGEIVLENQHGVVYKITIDPIIGKVKIIRQT
jgi:general secretion pathway protein H